jgi:hypothetical protein
MHIINRNELHPWRSTGPRPVPVTPAADAPTPAQADAAGRAGRKARSLLARSKSLVSGSTRLGSLVNL